MNITFDMMLSHPGIEDRLPLECRVIIKETLDFFKQRLGVLKEEMEQEEALTECWVIIIIMDDNEEKHPVKMIGYSDSLSDKIDNSFTGEDFDYLNRRLNGLYRGLSN